MNVADRLVQVLEEAEVKHIFGIPGEQILPMYDAIEDSSIEHILVRHEQAAAHAADAYYRSSGKFGVCISTAAPGALNFVMAVATAYKDNVPMLIITGDNPTPIKHLDYFQSFPLSKVFKGITFKSYDPSNGSEAIANLKEAIAILNHEAKGPIHLNLSNNITQELEFNEEEVNYIPDYDYNNIGKANKLIKESRKPFIILGSGAINSNINKIVNENSIPVSTTFAGKGIIDEKKEINLGLIGVRGSKKSDYALKNSDCVIAIGTRLSERTIKDFGAIRNKLIHVNIDKDKLKGNCQIHGDAQIFLNRAKFNKVNWLDEILNQNIQEEKVEGIEDEAIPLKPQSAINSVLKIAKNSIIVSDAGSHTTWTTLLAKPDSFGKLLFSGGLAPMGYGLPAAIGATIANPNEKVILICGDGDIQMNIQELATIKQYNLPIIIVVLNNNEYGIVRQFEEVYGMEPYQVTLENPNFIKIAAAYGIDSVKIDSKEYLEDFMKIAMNLDQPIFIEVNVAKEDIPLPK